MSPRRKAVLVVGGLAVVALVVGLAMATAHSVGGGSVSASSSIAPGAGEVVYSDDFKSNLSGWDTGDVPGDASYEYTYGGYTIAAAPGNYLHVAWAPYQILYEQASATISGRLGQDAPDDSGMGVVCERGSGSRMLTYEFVVGPRGDWYIGRRLGLPSSMSGPDLVREGWGAEANLTGAATVEGICASIDGQTTRLVLMIDGAVVADVVDTDASVPSGGWIMGIVLAGSDAGQTTATLTRFEERDLSVGSQTGGAAVATATAPTVDSTASPSATPYVAPSPINGENGRVSYTANFSSGWPLDGPGWAATTAKGAYTVTVSDAAHHVILAPNNNSILSMSVQAEFTQERGGADAGLAMLCTRDSGPTQLTYEFFVRADGSWGVDRVEGPFEGNPTVRTLKSASREFTQNTRVKAICSSIDGARTHLDFWINDTLVADLVDDNPGPSFGPWLAGVDLMGLSGKPYSASITSFFLVDLRQ